MTKTQHAYLATHVDNPPVTEFDCTEAELEEARNLGPNAFLYWAAEVNEIGHVAARAWARRCAS